jgi:hypothetical protein
VPPYTGYFSGIVQPRASTGQCADGTVLPADDTSSWQVRRAGLDPEQRKFKQGDKSAYRLRQTDYSDANALRMASCVRRTAGSGKASLFQCRKRVCPIGTGVATMRSSPASISGEK